MSEPEPQSEPAPEVSPPAPDAPPPGPIDAAADPDFAEAGAKPGRTALGSLAQSARLQRLKIARTILVVIGILYMLIYGAQLANAPYLVDQVIEELIREEQARAGPGEVVMVTPEDRAALLAVNRTIFGGLTALGGVFVIFGLLSAKVPVLATVMGLVLFLATNAAMGYLIPATLLSFWLLKLLAILGLIRAIQAAFAYQHHERPAGAVA